MTSPLPRDMTATSTGAARIMSSVNQKRCQSKWLQVFIVLLQALIVGLRCQA